MSARPQHLGPALFGLLLALIMPAHRAAAEQFVAADVSPKVVRVSSNFTGTEIVLFGTFIESKRKSFGAVPGSDLIVVVEGPPERVTVRHKERVGPIWMNVEGVTFTAAPSFYFVASTVPLTSLGETKFLSEHRIGLRYLELPVQDSSLPQETIETFKQALFDLRGRYRPPFREHVPRYAEIVDPPECRTAPGEECFFHFSASALFNAHLPIPANIPIGKLKITVYFLRNGRIVPNASQSWVLDVNRTGLEGWLYKHSESNPLLYGLGAIFIAVMAGGAASLVVRQ
jgi:Putative transmembrane protein (Alph_Pro_TM)